jgi:hypothetical protein
MVAIDNEEASTVARHFFEHWICRFNTPLEIVTDNVREFVICFPKNCTNYYKLDIQQQLHTGHSATVKQRWQIRPFKNA